MTRCRSTRRRRRSRPRRTDGCPFGQVRRSRVNWRGGNGVFQMSRRCASGRGPKGVAMSVACQLPSRPVPGRARRTAALAGLTAVLAAGAVAAAGPAAAEPAFGSAPATAEPAAPQTPVTIRSIAVGRHADFDRVVFRLSGPTAGYDVRYVPRLIQDPTGAVLPLAGSAVLTVVLRQTTWVDSPS